MSIFEETYGQITQRIGAQLATRESELAICEETLREAQKSALQECRPVSEV